MKDRILQIAKDSDWTLIKDQDNIKMMQFQNGADKMNVYWGTMTVVLLEKGAQPQTMNGVTVSDIRILFMGVKKTLWQRIKGVFK